MTTDVDPKPSSLSDSLTRPVARVFNQGMGSSTLIPHSKISNSSPISHGVPKGMADNSQGYISNQFANRNLLQAPQLEATHHIGQKPRNLSLCCHTPGHIATRVSVQKQPQC